MIEDRENGAININLGERLRWELKLKATIEKMTLKQYIIKVLEENVNGDEL